MTEPPAPAAAAERSSMCSAPTRYRRVYLSGFVDTAATIDAEVAFSRVVTGQQAVLAPICVFNGLSHAFEGLLITRVHRTEDAWTQYVEGRVKGLRVHTCEGLVRSEDGSGRPGEHSGACAARMIQLAHKIKGAVPPHFLDAYRLLTGGIMHRLDTREWKMRPSAMEMMLDKLDSIRTTLNTLQSKTTAAYNRAIRIEMHLNMGMCFDNMFCEEDMVAEFTRLYAEQAHLLNEVQTLEDEEKDILHIIARQSTIREALHVADHTRKRTSAQAGLD